MVWDKARREQVYKGRYEFDVYSLVLSPSGADGRNLMLETAAKAGMEEMLPRAETSSYILKF